MALERWVRAAVGPLSFDVAPVVALGALALVIAPLLSAGSQKEITPVTSTEIVDRSVSDTVTYVHLPGLTMPIVLPAPGGSTAPPYGILVRDALDSDAFTIVTTQTSPLQLESRYVVGRVARRDMSAALQGFEDRGESADGLDSSMLVVEVEPPADEPIRDVSAVGELADLSDQSLVRVPLAFDAESLPTCAVTASGCANRTLASGRGIFIHMARGILDGAPILVQTAYPSNEVPGAWTGTQIRNQPELEAWTATLPVQVFAGWGRILVLVSIVDDPAVVRSQLWLGPILLGLAWGWLWLGLRIGYPVFRAAVEGSRRWGSEDTRGGGPPPSLSPTAVRVSGHTTAVDGRRLHLDEAPATLVPAGVSGLASGRATASLQLSEGGEIALATGDVGALGTVERGEVAYIRGLRPALWVRWFGTDLRITFDSASERDLSARAIGARER